MQNLSQEDDKENLVAALWGAERCLRVLESVSTAVIDATLSPTTSFLLLNKGFVESSDEFISGLKRLSCSFFQQVTVQNPENQGYLIAYKDSQLIVSSAK